MATEGKKNILLVGKTGKGKSRIIEILCNETGLSSNDRTNSCTNKVTEHLLPNNEFNIIDTPGFGDSEGRDSLFIGQLYNLLIKLADGLVLVIYVKSALDRLDFDEKKNIDLLDNMFDNKIFTNFIIVLTFCDKEESETLSKTIHDHKTKCQNLPILPFFGKGEQEDISKSELLKIFREYAQKEPLITEAIKSVKCDQDKMRELEEMAKSAKNDSEQYQIQIEMLQLKLQQETNLHKMTEEARVSYIEQKEKGFQSFTYLGKALDDAVNLLLNPLKFISS